LAHIILEAGIFYDIQSATEEPGKPVVLSGPKLKITDLGCWGGLRGGVTGGRSESESKNPKLGCLSTGESGWLN
jgi:hypothetical protein